MTVEIIPVTGLGEVNRGDDIASMLAPRLHAIGIRNRDVLVVTQKVVSKAEGALALAPDESAFLNVVEQESEEVLRRRGDMVISVTKHGFVCANAGVDRSNVTPGQVVLLPRDPDKSARRLVARLRQLLAVEVAVIITDTFGRAWRTGLVDVAIGVAGMNPILDLRGTTDMQGRVLEATEVAVADEIAAAAELVMGKAAGVPAAVVRGVGYVAGDGSARDLVRDPAGDLFR
ncbi:MAG TPA: coenzyme F420-0:L-glutamate ligase [Acidimicrobiia bacterium]|nr:coenzyme F420-0:L-glutamate ligase [Acidimicrobiia bacterium]